MRGGFYSGFGGGVMRYVEENSRWILGGRSCFQKAELEQPKRIVDDLKDKLQIINEAKESAIKEVEMAIMRRNLILEKQLYWLGITSPRCQLKRARRSDHVRNWVMKTRGAVHKDGIPMEFFWFFAKTPKSCLVFSLLAVPNFSQTSGRAIVPLRLRLCLSACHCASCRLSIFDYDCPSATVPLRHAEHIFVSLLLSV
ncbi:hypothetical protein L1887_35939 [Cichorium endivia]|nr:hypothetical protein L1887_35939 [Cichorium endivia]